ncbi:drug/metabolite transporter (DMT)-like permease [Algoriphagus sp. 4150]|uniref:EamA family transporter n=1 Tax=Algoriphagus sp. 4150 TaxID=2817756 RepID=UPI00285F05D3|nr:EamA family transporter [Algoriphagus sp. 4150]MDR7128170.1 drug/metabolite transporter (DMT)-like permease [Algoriphagus sp. 4150]
MHDTLLLSFVIGLRIISNPLGNVFQKHLTIQGLHPLWVNFLTYFLLASICLVGLFFLDSIDLREGFWIYSLLGGIFGAMGNGLLVKALHKGNLSILGPINSYKSIVGLIFGIFLLGEIPNLWGILGIGVIIYGSYLVLDTTEERFTPTLLRNKDIQFRIGAMLLTAIEAVFVKKVILASSPTLAFISWCFFGAFFSFLLVLIFRVNPMREFSKVKFDSFSKFILLIGCIGIMQLSTNYIFENMNVGYALSLFQLSIIFSVLLGYRIFQEKDIRKKIIGSAIMIAGSVMIILSN